MKYLIIALIILSGIFNYQVPNETRYYPAQFSFFIFSSCIFGSYLLYKKNKWIGLLAGLFTFSFLKTFLLGQGELLYLYKEMLVGIAIFLIYYTVRMLKLKEDMLKWFLIPVALNIVLL